MVAFSNKKRFAPGGKPTVSEPRLQLIHDPNVIRHLEIRASEEHNLFVHTMRKHKQLHSERDKITRLLDPVAIQKQITTIVNLENDVRQLHARLAKVRNETALLHAQISGE